jgi:transcriptional regulator with XRE-family HTH domain
MTLADKIMKLRKKNGFSQDELAERLNVSRQSVSKWESGTSMPDLNKIVMLSGIFGVSTDYLLKEEIEDEEYRSKVQKAEQEEKQEDRGDSGKEKKSKEKEEKYESLYWSAAVVIYLLVSFVTGQWAVTWILWPIAVVLSMVLFEIVNWKNK